MLRGVKTEEKSGAQIFLPGSPELGTGSTRPTTRGKKGLPVHD